MNDFSIRRLDVGRLHISLVRNDYAAKRCSQGNHVGMWRVPRMTAITVHVRHWFLNLDWLS